MGAKGNVVGLIGPLEVDVIFDREIDGGTTLNSRCKPYRGARVQTNQILNLTTPQPPHHLNHEKFSGLLFKIFASSKKIELPQKMETGPETESEPEPETPGSSTQNPTQKANRNGYRGRGGNNRQKPNQRSNSHSKPKPSNSASREDNK